jgi:hypothetical protein
MTISHEAIWIKVQCTVIENRAIAELRRASTESEQKAMHTDRAIGQIEALRQLTGETFHSVFARCWRAAQDTAPYSNPRPVRVTP